MKTVEHIEGNISHLLCIQKRVLDELGQRVLLADTVEVQIGNIHTSMTVIKLLQDLTGQIVERDEVSDFLSLSTLYDDGVYYSWTRKELGAEFGLVVLERDGVPFLLLLIESIYFWKILALHQPGVTFKVDFLQSTQLLRFDIPSHRMILGVLREASFQILLWVQGPVEIWGG